MQQITNAQIKDQVKAFAAPPWWYAYKPALHFAALAFFLFLTLRTPGGWKALWIIAAASQFLGLYALLHGASHWHLSKQGKVNDLIGTLLGMALGTTFHGYRVCHLRHHANLRQSDDPQEVV